MLDIALNHREELQKQFRKTWFEEKFKYYHGSYYSDFELDNTTWNKHQFVSLDREGNVIGYIWYNIDRESNNVNSIAAINFSEDTITFGKDLGRALKDIFEKYKFNKINFNVTIGNPIEKSYDKLISRCHGRIVGVYKKDCKLMDGTICDTKIYEILREDYLDSQKGNHARAKI